MDFRFKLMDILSSMMDFVLHMSNFVSLQFPEASPVQEGGTDLVEEVFCVPEGKIYQAPACSTDLSSAGMFY